MCVLPQLYMDIHKHKNEFMHTHTKVHVQIYRHKGSNDLPVENKLCILLHIDT